MGIDAKTLRYDWVTAKTRAQTVVGRLTKGIEYLWKKNNVEFVKGEAKILSAHEIEVSDRLIQAENIMIATGSKPQALEGVDSKLVIELERLFDLDALPKKPLIIGKGPVALETLEYYRLLGIPATLLVKGDNLLPGLDPYIVNFMKKKLKKAKMPVHYSEEFTIEGSECKVGDKVIKFDKIINANWRTAILPEMNSKVELENGYVKVDKEFRTSIPNIFAVGDVNGESYMAHAASAQGLAVINRLKGIEEDYLGHAFKIIADHEEVLSNTLLDFLKTKKNVKIIGPESGDKSVRVPTISFVVEGRDSESIVLETDKHKIGIRFGDFYAAHLIDDIGIRKQQGVVRVSMVHYNTIEELQKLIKALNEII
jgi:dihydrolipoamide dehydrogenase